MNTFSTRMELRAYREPWIRDAISLRMAQIRNANGVQTVSIVEPLTLRTLDEKDMGRELAPALNISTEDAQQFMDELWRVGIRPTEGAGSVGQLAATERHLQDMRKIAFKGEAS